VRNNSTWARLQLLPTNWPKGAWNPWLTGITFAGVVFLFVAAQTAYVLAGVHFGTIDPANITKMSATQEILLQLCSFVPVTIFLLVVLPMLARVPLSSLGFRAPTGRELLIAVLGAVAMMVFVDGLGALLAALSHHHDTEEAVALLRQMKTPLQRTLFFALACIFAPFYEELTFRVFLFNAFSRYTPVWIAIVLSAIPFGLLHAVGGASFSPLTVGLPLAVGGAILAYVYSVTKCFWVNVITHALFNSISVVGVFFFHAT
jgi:membrane protease YdiL (CAAX protease family)